MFRIFKNMFQIQVLELSQPLLDFIDINNWMRVLAE